MNDLIQFELGGNSDPNNFMVNKEIDPDIYNSTLDSCLGV